MRILIVMAAAILAALTGPVAAQTPEQQRQLDWVLERGRLLYALDRAAWVATDDMMARVPRAQQQDLRGYIVDRDGPDFAVIFFADDGGRPVAMFRARVSDGRVMARELFQRGERPALAAGQQRLARIREQLAAARPNLSLCSRSQPNLAAIPPATPDGPIDIYITTPQTQATVSRSADTIASRSTMRGRSRHSGPSPIRVSTSRLASPVANGLWHSW